MTPELIERADNLKVIGRAGTGVDNVDIPAATRRGIIVANAPESNSVAAAEHTLALLLALFRNVPQAHGSLVDGRWDRAKFKGAELYGKTLGVIGFGRIGQLVAKRAQTFEMEVDRLRQVRLRRALPRARRRGRRSLEELLERADVVTLHVPKTPETIGLIDAEAIAAMKDGARIVNCARGELVDLDALDGGPRVRQGRRRRARRLPLRALHRAPDLRPRRRRRHPAPRRLDRRGAGPRRRRHRRAGDRGADRRRRHQRGQHRRRPPRGDGGAGARSCRSAKSSAASPRASARARSTGSRSSSAAESPTTTRACSASPCWSGSSPATPRSRSTSSTRRRWPRSAGSSWSRPRTPAPRTSPSWSPSASAPATKTVEVAGTGVGPRNEPYLVSVWGEGFYLPFAEHLAVFRYADQPGMIGRVGTMFGEEGVNIVSAAVGAESGGEHAVMALTTDAAVARRRSPRSSSSTASPSAARSTSSCDRSSRLLRRCSARRLDRERRSTRFSRSRSVPTRRSARARCGSRSSAAGINFADTMARVGLYPDAPKTPCVLGYEVAGEVETVGDGVERLHGRRPRRRRHPFGGQAELVTVPRPTGAAAARAAQLRAGRRVPGQLRHRLRGADRDGQPARGQPRPDPRRRRRRRDRRDPDRPQRRRRDLRHRLARQARGDPRPGRRAPDRLPQPGLRGRGRCGSPAARAST